MARLGVPAMLTVDAAISIHARRLWTTLPDRVASHFNAAGQPNGWMPREGFVEVYLGLALLTTCALLLARMGIGGRAEARLRLPNREYWLAPERRAETIAWLREWSSWMGVAVLAMLAISIHLAASYNLGDGAAMGSRFIALLVGFLAVMGILTGAMVLKFARTTD